VQWVVNQAMNREVFNTLYTRNAGHYMKRHPELTIAKFLESDKLF